MPKRKKKRPLIQKKKRREVVVGVTWYTSDQFAQMKSMADDAESLDDTYEEWLENATRQVQRLKNEGYQVTKVPIEVDEWVAWCQQHGKPLTGASRSGFVSQKASEGVGISSPSGQFVSRHIKPRRNPIPLLDRLETLFEAERDKSSPPPYPFDANRNLIHLPIEVENHLRQLVRNGQPIEAVRQVTRLTGAGLRMAKDYVDGLVG